MNADERGSGKLKRCSVARAFSSLDEKGLHLVEKNEKVMLSPFRKVNLKTRAFSSLDEKGVHLMGLMIRSEERTSTGVSVQVWAAMQPSTQQATGLRHI